LQIYVPLNTSTSYDATKPYSHSLAQALEGEYPEVVVSRMEKRLRAGKVFVDWSQNDRHKTTICVYSLRAKEKPTVSTPITWDEVNRAMRKRDAAALTFVSADVLRRIDEKGDLFEPVLTLKQKI
jgi:bifunctional non-homologous end joining protein LigD